MDISVSDLDSDAQTKITKLVADGQFETPEQALSAALARLGTLPELDEIWLSVVKHLGDEGLKSGIADDFGWDDFLRDARARNS